MYRGDGEGSWYATGGAGGAGTSYSGGAGGGSVNANVQLWSGLVGGAGEKTAVGGSALARREPTWAHRRSGGGAGNPGGKGASTSSQADAALLNGANGSGGLLVIRANSLSGSGLIQSNGIGAKDDYAWLGGASGGGSINIYYKDNVTITNFEVNGGYNVNLAGEVVRGGKGGNGSVNINEETTGSSLNY